MGRFNAVRITVALVLMLGSAIGLAAQCSMAPDLDARDTDWSGWGNGYGNTRHAPNGITSGDLEALKLRWAFGFADTGSVVGNPVIHGNTLFIGVDSGVVYALDADTACVHWTFKADTGVRTAPAFGIINAEPQLFFGDNGGQVYSVDARSGRQQWKVEVESHPAARLTGSPQYFHVADETVADRLLVPVSSGEEGLGAVPGYNCCTFRGSVVSLDAATGNILWQSYTILPPAVPTGENTSGPSGGAIWSAPTLDPENRVMYVTTGDAYSAPADIGTDALIAMDLLTGEHLWISQGTADDIWTVACMRPGADEDCGPDQDYGSPALLVPSETGVTLLAGQKSGIVRAFAQSDGAVQRATALVENTTEFGGKIIWGGASDGIRGYFGLGTGGIAGVNVADGNIDWFTPIEPAAERSRNIGHDGPLTVTGDLVLSGGWDGLFRILSAATGELLWQFDTVRAFETVNGVDAKGGSMGAAGPVVSGKRLFVPTGYVGVKNGMQGNALLMFSP
jgi:polyvinyl alcohol dehydrogenase (cytochrome)